MYQEIGDDGHNRKKCYSPGSLTPFDSSVPDVFPYCCFTMWPNIAESTTFCLALGPAWHYTFAFSLGSRHGTVLDLSKSATVEDLEFFIRRFDKFEQGCKSSGGRSR